MRMGWATGYIARLKGGETVSFRPRGNSMLPKIHSGDLCTVAPVDPAALAVDDIVLCKVNGNEYPHLVKAIQGNVSTRRGQRRPRRQARASPPRIQLNAPGAGLENRRKRGSASGYADWQPHALNWYTCATLIMGSPGLDLRLASKSTS